MIVLNLKCDADHAFEGWFASSEAFEDQSVRLLVSCPVCSSHSIQRLPSGPRVMRSTTRVEEDCQAVLSPSAQAMQAYARMVAESENVAERFPDEARRIHYGEAPERSIRGKASLEDTRALIEEGIMVLPLPYPAKEDTH